MCLQRNLYNCVNYDKDEMYRLCESLNEGITSKCEKGLCHDSHHINHNSVSDAISKLKSHKSDGVYVLLSDSLIHSCRSLHVHLSLLFSAMLRHGTVPQSMSLSTIIPIPKNRRKCLNDSSIYRGIALGSLLGKVLDNILLCDNVNILQTSDMQFGFKSKHSTTQCTFVLNEVIDYYLRHDSSIYLVLLDASQAFDRVQYVKLFRLLVKRGICPLTARLLAHMYTSQLIRVSWNGHVSNPFTTSNGVKQGAILSPILFCVYIDVLLLQLERSKFGCYIGSRFCGSFGYADDICILAPSRKATQSMLDICQKVASEYDIKFNVSKTQLLLINCPVNVRYSSWSSNRP